MTVLSISPTGATPREIARAINQLASGRINIVSKAAAYTLANGDDVLLADATAGAFTVTLPLVALYTGKVFTVKKIDASGNAVTIDGAGSETIDGATTRALAAQYDSLTLLGGSSEWHLI